MILWFWLSRLYVDISIYRSHSLTFCFKLWLRIRIIVQLYHFNWPLVCEKYVVVWRKLYIVPSARAGRIAKLIYLPLSDNKMRRWPNTLPQWCIKSLATHSAVWTLIELIRLFWRTWRRVSNRTCLSWSFDWCSSYIDCTERQWIKGRDEAQ